MVKTSVVYSDSLDRLCEIEHVERKGIGHPDTICDAIAESASRLYAKYCYEKYGRLANHWFDKVMLIGGESRIEYGNTELIRPYRIIFAGKVTRRVGVEELPITAILQTAVDGVLSTCLTGYLPGVHAVIVDELVDYQGAGRGAGRYRPSSPLELQPLSGFSDLPSNDCNLVVANSNYTLLEELVLCVEKHINSTEFKRRHPESGWDVKVVGARTAEGVEITVNVPVLAGVISGREEYDTVIQSIKAAVEVYIHEFFPRVNLRLVVNPQDRTGHPYLTSLGSAADTGDVGVVGRGNRANGLITPMRAMSIEAACGKNPIDHTGKIYTIIAKQLADLLREELGHPIQIHIATVKETPICRPDHVAITVFGVRTINNEPDRLFSLVNNYFEKLDERAYSIVFPTVTLW